MTKPELLWLTLQAALYINCFISVADLICIDGERAEREQTAGRRKVGRSERRER